MTAMFQTGGKQYKVSEGDVIYVEKLPAEPGQKVEFDTVLAVVNGADSVFGAPYIAGAKVVANVVSNGKSKKIMIFKFKAKKNYRRRQGHRQPYTKLQIDSILA
jgi:large subunit ribosomal protein L21